MIIESGIGNGKFAAVDEDNRILTASFNIPFTHLIAKDYNRVFTIEGNTTPTPGEVNVLHVKNNSTSNIVVVTRVIMQAVTLSGGTATPNSGNYFQLLNGLGYTSGGLSAPVANTSSGSAVTSDVNAYDSNPVLSGSGTSLGRHYPLDSSPYEIRTEGSIIILPQQSFTVGYTGDQTGGFLYALMGLAVVSATGYSG